MGIWYSLYYQYNRTAVNAGMRSLRNVPAERFYDECLKKTVENHPVKSITRVNEDIIDVAVCMGRGTCLFRYHRCCFVTIEQYEIFISAAEKEKAKRAFYITCGSFDESIIKANRNLLFLMEPRAFLVDGLHIVKKLLGLRRRWRGRMKRLRMMDLYVI